MIRKIRVDDLKPGMYIHDFDQSWIEIPFMFKSFMVRNEKIIGHIKKNGIKEIYIDTSRGDDADCAPEQEAVELETAPEEWNSEVSGAGIDPAVPFERGLERAAELRREAGETVAGLMREVREGDRLDMTIVDETVVKMAESVFDNPSALIFINRMKKTDEYTTQHSIDCCVFMLAFGRSMGMDIGASIPLGIGGLLHDIGKMRVPMHILNKPSKLTQSEFSTVRKHVDFGVEILMNREDVPETALNIVREHHERFDGSGYPFGKKGRSLTIEGQMGAIVDVYDAITTDRCYHASLQPAAALRKLYEWSEFHFDRSLVERFIKCVGIFPPGTVVRLESGLVGYVIKGSEKNSVRPLVRVIFDTRSGNMISPVRDLDLSSEPSADSIVCVESADKYGIDLDLCAVR